MSLKAVRVVGQEKCATQRHLIVVSFKEGTTFSLNAAEPFE